MNIMENKRVTAIAALMGVAFAGICYKGYESYAALKQARSEIDAKISQLETYTAEDDSDGEVTSSRSTKNPLDADRSAAAKLAPTAKNSDLIVSATKEMKQLNEELKRDFAKYVKFCRQGEPNASSSTPIGYVPNVAAIDFKNRLVGSVSVSLAKEAEKYGTLLKSEAAKKLGMADYFGGLTGENAPYLNFLLSAVYRVETSIIHSGAPTINFVYCAPLPEELINARKKPDFIPLSFEVSFEARRSEVVEAGKESSYSVLPQVINKLVHDSDFFFTITGVSVTTHGALPSVSAAAAQSATAEESAAAEGEADSGPAEDVATLLVGKSDDTVHVHLNLQVLYFTTDNP